MCAIDPMSHKIWLTMRRVIFRLGNCTVEWDDNNMHVIACLGVAVLRMHAVEVTRAFFKLEKYRNGCDTGLRARGAQEAGGAPPPAAAGVARTTRGGGGHSVAERRWVRAVHGARHQQH